MAKKPYKRSAYAEKLLDPRWQRLRLEVMQRDDFACRNCGDKEKTLHVHHGFYDFGLEPWDYPSGSLHTYCEECHETADIVRSDIKHITGCMPLEGLCALFEIIRALHFSTGGTAIEVLTQMANLAGEYEKQGNAARNGRIYEPNLAITEV